LLVQEHLSVLLVLNVDVHLSSSLAASQCVVVTCGVKNDCIAIKCDQLFSGAEVVCEQRPADDSCTHV